MVVMWARPVMLQMQRHGGQAWLQLRLRQRGWLTRKMGVGGRYVRRSHTQHHAGEGKGLDGGRCTGSGEDGNGWRRRTDAVWEHVPWAPESYQPHYYYSGMCWMPRSLCVEMDVCVCRCLSGSTDAMRPCV